ncbi:hypothetical protein AVEN_262228-1 [Araneus ventricosus]|uniref:Uncharacterized protein n=1 Tax=Araneus ventricosus TaxID=182803 RepID=A0A4Y2J8E2_ARAVE|nr:hypothetical protein AVEN_262228-1 [Araneus ventricosus]
MKWQIHWDQEINNKLHSIKPIIENWSEDVNRKRSTILTRLRIGHTRFTHRHLLLVTRGHSLLYSDSLPTSGPVLEGAEFLLCNMKYFLEEGLEVGGAQTLGRLKPDGKRSSSSCGSLRILLELGAIHSQQCLWKVVVLVLWVPQNLVRAWSHSLSAMSLESGRPRLVGPTESC